MGKKHQHVKDGDLSEPWVQEAHRLGRPAVRDWDAIEAYHSLGEARDSIDTLSSCSGPHWLSVSGQSPAVQEWTMGTPPMPYTAMWSSSGQDNMVMY